MTSRNRNETFPPETIDYVIDKSTGGEHYRTEQTCFSGNHTMSDVVSPNFNARMQAGEIINNPMSYWVLTERHSEERCVYSYIQNSSPQTVYNVSQGNATHQFLYHVYGIWVENPLDPFDNIDHLTDIAQQKCLAKVDSTPVALAEDMGEIRETIRFLKRPIQSIERLVKTFVGDKKKATKIKNAWERTQAIADLWNTYRFAVAPLMRSVVDLLELTANKEPNRPKRRRSSGRTRDMTFSQTPKVVRATPSHMSQVIQYELEGARELHIHASILYEVSNPLVDWKFKLGLRFKDLPTTGWELLPLSFMVDRLLDIRSFFAGAINILDPQVTFLAGSYSVKNLDQHTVSLTERQYSGWTHEITKPDFIQFEIFHMERLLWNPQFFDTIPSFTPGGLVKDLTSILDLLAILASLAPSVNSNSPRRPS